MVVAQVFNASTGEAGAGRTLVSSVTSLVYVVSSSGKPGLHSVTTLCPGKTTTQNPRDQSQNQPHTYLHLKHLALYILRASLLL